MIRSAPFARARLMMAAISVALAGTGNDIAARLTALAGIDTNYQSRGKGRGAHQASRRSIATDKRDSRKARNQQRHKRACRG